MPATQLLQHGGHRSGRPQRRGKESKSVHAVSLLRSCNARTRKGTTDKTDEIPPPHADPIVRIARRIAAYILIILEGNLAEAAILFRRSVMGQRATRPPAVSVSA